MRKISFPLIGLLLIGLDQWSKFWITANLDFGQVKTFLPGIFSLTYLRNYGAAFSMLQKQQWLFTLITLAVISFATYYFIKNIKGDLWLLIGLLLIISGGLGNFIDRLRLGYVVDMVQLDFIDFAIFNIADSYLTVGVLVLLIAFWKEGEDGHKN